MTMGILEFFDFIYENNVDLQVVGEIESEDDEIKCSYEALGDDYDDIDEHLHVILEDDLETFEDFIDEHNLSDSLTILPPEFDDTRVRFLIVEA